MKRLRIPGKLAVAICLIAFTTSLFARDVILSWTHSTSPSVTTYRIYRGTVSGGPYSLITPTNGTGFVNTYTDANVPGGTYYYVATAVDSTSNESAYSNQAQAIVPGGSRCDINGDGVVNIIDIQWLVNIVLGVAACPSSNCDVNSDGAVNILDI